MPKLTIEQLNRLYLDSEQVDKETFAEQRSNVLLVAGEHYTKNSNKYFARLRETNRLTERQKLRLTKNHCHRIVRHYKNQILSKAPGVAVLPNNEKEMQDQKTAELNQKVWVDAQVRYDIKEKMKCRLSDFITIGECAHKIFWDPNEGDLIGYEPRMMEDGSHEMDDLGNPIADEAKPVYSGAFAFEPIFGFNLFRSTIAKSMEDSPYLGLRKMVGRDHLLKLYQDDEKKKKFIQESEDQTYIVFDTNQVNYSRTQKEVLVKEIYFKPCYDDPEGYYYIFTEMGVLEEGALPFGVFPIVWEGFDVHATAPRGKSILKVARPYQAELNRASSQIATHQITVGDDKVIYQSGTKLAPGALLPGVRGITYQGAPPTILPGRDGSQYMDYMAQQEREMYRAVMMEEIDMNKSMNLEPHQLLFTSMKHQVVYSEYAERFERFYRNTCEVFLSLARHYYDDQMLANILGPDEVQNIPEFKRAGKFSYQIKLESRNDTMDTMLGKQMTLTTLLQYAGKSLDRSDIGKIARVMPFTNNEEIFSEMTIEYDNVKNDMLALERGEQPRVEPYDDNDYYGKKLVHRMKQPDFKQLDPMIQQNYQQFLQVHQQESARKAQALKAAQSEFIPVGGAMITCQMHIQDAKNPEKTKQVRVPYQALDWLVGQLEKQGMSMDKMESMNRGQLAELAQMMGPMPPLGPPQAQIPQGGPNMEAGIPPSIYQ